MEEDKDVHVIVGLSYLDFGRVLINMQNRELKLNVNPQSIIFLFIMLWKDMMKVISYKNQS